ncbi:MAG: hypothetical protein ACKOXB_14150 [Flavobacteriales bacterium]
MRSFLLALVLIAGSSFNLQSQDSTNLQFQLQAKRISLFNFSYKTGKHSNGYGLSYFHFPKQNHGGWYFPYSISVENISVKYGSFSQLNFQSSPLNFFLPGIHAFRNIGDYLWINIGMQVPISAEQVSDIYGKVSTHAIIGVAPMQQIFIIPRTPYGLVFGIGFYEKFTNSYVYQDDVGVRAELGLKF